jgi:hypothetical protein
MNTSKTTISFNSLFYNTLEQYVERISLFLENLIFLKIDLFVNDFNQDFHLGEVVPNPVFFNGNPLQSYDIVMNDFPCIQDVIYKINEIIYGPELTNVPDSRSVYEINLVFYNKHLTHGDLD